MSPTLVLTDAPTAADAAAVREALRAHNAAAGFPSGRRELAVLLRDAAGRVEGGLIGITAWGWLFVENLALPPGRRGQGLGARILAMAEAEARARGCTGIRLDTYSFQSPGFYARMGYEEVARIADCPAGQTRFTFVRRLHPAPSEQPPCST